MFEWVDVNVRQTTFDISLISTSVLEESPLPKTTFALVRAAVVDRPFEIRFRQPSFRKFCFDEPPASRKIVVATWEFPQRMDMVGQQNDSNGLKWTTQLYGFHRLTEAEASKIRCQDGLALVRDERKEKNRSFA